MRVRTIEPTVNLSIVVESTETEEQKLKKDQIQPPQKPLSYVEYDTTNATEFLRKNIQPAWWTTEYQTPISSELVQANFCQYYNKQLTTLSGGLFKPPPVTIITEWCLMREIIWMLLCDPAIVSENGVTSTDPTLAQSAETDKFSLNSTLSQPVKNREPDSKSTTSTIPQSKLKFNKTGASQADSDLKLNTTTKPTSSQPHLIKLSTFFSLNILSQEIIVNRHVSLSSVTVDGIQQILTDFAKYMTYLYRFRMFFASVYNLSGERGAPPYTIECYATGLKEFVDNIVDFLLKKEIELIENDPTGETSVVKLYNELGEHFRMLNYLYDIHQSCYLDYKSHSGEVISYIKLGNDLNLDDFSFIPAHVCSKHLLSSLLSKTNTAPSASYLNLAASLFLVSIRYYMVIFNSWWLDGRFDDWRQEFLVER